MSGTRINSICATRVAPEKAAFRPALSRGSSAGVLPENTMPDIKAIETIYKGYRFRSRLEARWAVYFDALKIKYEYELEGFELASKLKYLPDFYLPEHGVYVEVKPHDQVPYAELRKIMLFGVDGDMRILLIVGTPSNEEMYLVDRMTTVSWDEMCAELSEYDEEGRCAIFFQSLGDYGHVEFGEVPGSRDLRLIYKNQTPNRAYGLAKAILDAKQARFEHGESGAPRN